MFDFDKILTGLVLQIIFMLLFSFSWQLAAITSFVGLAFRQTICLFGLRATSRYIIKEVVKDLVFYAIGIFCGILLMKGI